MPGISPQALAAALSGYRTAVGVAGDKYTGLGQGIAQGLGQAGSSIEDAMRFKAQQEEREAERAQTAQMMRERMDWQDARYDQQRQDAQHDFRTNMGIQRMMESGDRDMERERQAEQVRMYSNLMGPVTGLEPATGMEFPTTGAAPPPSAEFAPPPSMMTSRMPTVPEGVSRLQQPGMGVLTLEQANAAIRELAKLNEPPPEPKPSLGAKETEAYRLALARARGSAEGAPPKPVEPKPTLDQEVERARALAEAEASGRAAGTPSKPLRAPDPLDERIKRLRIADPRVDALRDEIDALIRERTATVPPDDFDLEANRAREMELRKEIDRLLREAEQSGGGGSSGGLKWDEFE